MCFRKVGGDQCNHLFTWVWLLEITIIWTQDFYVRVLCPVFVEDQSCSFRWAKVLCRIEARHYPVLTLWTSLLSRHESVTVDKWTTPRRCCRWQPSGSKVLAPCVVGCWHFPRCRLESIAVFHDEKVEECHSEELSHYNASLFLFFSSFIKQLRGQMSIPT